LERIVGSSLGRGDELFGTGRSHGHLEKLCCHAPTMTLTAVTVNIL
jgi:hypothetical protein